MQLLGVAKQKRRQEGQGEEAAATDAASGGLRVSVGTPGLIGFDVGAAAGGTDSVAGVQLVMRDSGSLRLGGAVGLGLRLGCYLCIVLPSRLSSGGSRFLSQGSEALIAVALPL